MTPTPTPSPALIIVQQGNDFWTQFGFNVVGGIATGVIVGAVLLVVQLFLQRRAERDRALFAWYPVRARLAGDVALPIVIPRDDIPEYLGSTQAIEDHTRDLPLLLWSRATRNAQIETTTATLQAIWSRAELARKLNLAIDAAWSLSAPETNGTPQTGYRDYLVAKVYGTEPIEDGQQDRWNVFYEKYGLGVSDADRERLRTMDLKVLIQYEAMQTWLIYER